MLGYPAGHVDLDGISRTAQLRALGNSVQVQVAEAIGFYADELLEMLP